MSAGGKSASARARAETRSQFEAAAGAVDRPRALAMTGVVVLVVSSLSVMYRLVDITGQPAVLLLEVAVALAAATVLSRSMRVRTASVLAAGLFALGLVLYVYSLPRQPPLGPLVTDAVALVTGRSLLQVANVDLWVLGVAPGPLFLTWYLSLRRHYVSAALVGGATLTFLVLTGDAGSVTALLGVVGGVTAIGVGDIEQRGDDIGTAEPLAVLLALMILLPTFATVVPGGPSGSTVGLSTFQEGGTGGAGTVEASLVDAGDQIGVQGNISLSPEARFRVRASSESYWQVGSFDRYTGDGWVRTGESRGYGGDRLEGPPGQSRPISQRVTAVDSLSIVPAAWRPVSGSGAGFDQVSVTTEDGFALGGTLSAGDSYTVQSQAPVADAETLRSAGDDYPEDVESRYTPIPSSTPDRLAERTARITQNADNAYDTARVIERWLENNKEYSLDVDRPNGNVADSFLFEMEAGYCTYFATTMVTMLRSQDIPARLAVGYTPGERVDRDEWVVRGYDAHAWVQVYFPDVGWVRFDPTPAAPRQEAERSELAEAREQNRTDVDLNDTGGGEWTPTATATPAPLTPSDEQAGPPVDDPGGPPTITTRPDDVAPGVLDRVEGSNATAANVTTAGTTGAASAGGGGIDLPSREEATLLGIAAFGLVLGVRRLGAARRLYRVIWVRYQPRSDPPTDAERAYERLEYVLERRYRPRRPGETPRQYLAAVGADERANTVALIRERARYAGEVTREEADRAVDLVDELVAG